MFSLRVLYGERPDITAHHTKSRGSMEEPLHTSLKTDALAFLKSLLTHKNSESHFNTTVIDLTLGTSPKKVFDANK